MFKNFLVIIRQKKVLKNNIYLGKKKKKKNNLFEIKKIDCFFLDEFYITNQTIIRVTIEKIFL